MTRKLTLLGSAMLSLTASCGAGKGGTAAYQTPAAASPTQTAASASNATGVQASTGSAAIAAVPAATTWCGDAAKTQLVSSAAHSAGFQALCQNGAATVLFNTLIANAYGGGSGGTPAVTQITPIVDVNGVATAFSAAAQILPISSAAEYRAVGPLQGTSANELSLMKALNETPVSAVVAPEPSNADTGWSRGWTITDNSTQTAGGQGTVNTIFTYKADQYNFEDGSYMYASTFVPPAIANGTVTNYQLLVASFDIGGIGYLTTVGNFASADNGFATIAQSTLELNFDNLLVFNYSTAAAANP